ncbi:MAG: IS110 family transposase [Planctomycetota bacterium]|nr:IS110 family transposase [Planctomycetota bacterium]
MTAIGIDTHKATLAACAVDGLGAPLDERTFPNDPAGHRALAAWARQVAPGAVIGLEGSASYGAAAARFLLAQDEQVREVPPQLSRRERTRTRRAGKSDPGDALAIARVTAREMELPPVRVADRTREIGLLVEAREDAVAETTRVRNRVHADLVVLMPGYQAEAKNLVAERYRRIVVRRLRRLAGVQAGLALGRLARLRALDAEMRALTARIAVLVGPHPLLGLSGVGVLTAAKLIAETGDVKRFRSPDAFAALAGVAPIPASSGQTNRMRLNRGGNRQLNRALHTIATVQVIHHPPAREYLARKRTEQKTRREAVRALKRQLVRTVFRLLREGAPGLALDA